MANNGERRQAELARAKGEALAEAWFRSGERVAYDPATQTLSDAGDGPLRVWLRRDGDVTTAVTFLPGFPDGSIGWSRVVSHLPGATEMPRLFVEYVGMGDSDKPKRYPYSTAERTDLVEAVWRHLGVRSTTLVAFDFSSLVILEHLRRRLERAGNGQSADYPHIRGVFVFNGGLYTDGHSHPWFTTPLLRRPGGGVGPWLGERSFLVFRQLARPLWSKSYPLDDDEIHALRAALSRRGGMSYLSRAAGFAADHVRQGERLDFGRLFEAYREQFPFLVGGSREDKFEPRQIALAERRLPHRGLRIERLPGGHLTTAEHPAPLAGLIVDFERSLTARATGPRRALHPTSN